MYGSREGVKRLFFLLVIALVCVAASLWRSSAAAPLSTLHCHQALSTTINKLKVGSSAEKRLVRRMWHSPPPPRRRCLLHILRV